MYNILKIFFLFLLLCITACTSSKKIIPKEENANIELSLAKEKVPGITMQQLKSGSKIYIRSCSGCHALRKPSAFTAEQWHPILAKMFIRSKISDSTTRSLITDYVIAKSK